LPFECCSTRLRDCFGACSTLLRVGFDSASSALRGCSQCNPLRFEEVRGIPEAVSEESRPMAEAGCNAARTPTDCRPVRIPLFLFMCGLLLSERACPSP